MRNERRLIRYVLLPHLLLACLAAVFVCTVFFRSDSSLIVAASPNVARGAITRETSLAVFDDAWSTINQRYYDRTFHGLDWEAQRNTYRELAAKAESTHALYAVLRRMIAALNDSHTRVFAPEEKFDWWRPRFVTIGISVKEIEGLPTVVQVERDSAPDRQGIRAGDVIQTVDGQPALAVVNKRLEQLGQNLTGPSRRRAFSSMFEGVAATTVEVSWKTRNEKVKTARFQRYWRQRELGIRFRRNDGFQVIEMDAFTKTIAASFASKLRDFRNARGFILDFRSNGGGDAEAMTDVASAFLANGSSLGHFTDRFGSSYQISTRRKSPSIARAIEQTRAPVIVLTSERTSSAAEIFIAALRASSRARVIGVETCGCVLAIRHRHTLPDGGMLDVSEMDYQTPSGHRLERHGLQPDHTVNVQRADLYEDRDRVMEMALSELKKPSTRLN